MAEWWRWRDRDAAQMHWFAADVGKAGALPAAFTEMVIGLQSRPAALRNFIDIFNHRVAPSRVLTPPRLLGAATRLLRAGTQPRRAVARETWGLVRTDLRRKRFNRYPVYDDQAKDSIRRAEAVSAERR